MQLEEYVNSQLEGFKELVVLLLRPALPRLGDCVRLPNLLAGILGGSSCGGGVGGDGAKPRKSHTQRVQKESLCWRVYGNHRMVEMRKPPSSSLSSASAMTSGWSWIEKDG
ncbi:hypothetical protein ACLOJK_004390 [Asimina triloba]